MAILEKSLPENHVSILFCHFESTLIHMRFICEYELKLSSERAQTIKDGYYNSGIVEVLKN